MNYKKQSNSIVKLSRQQKKEHFNDFNPFHDPKPFWRTCKPFFSSKHSFGESKIVLTEKVEIMTKSSKVAKTFSFYFASVTKSLDLSNRPYLVNNATNKTQ